jgi:hypothetical protein
MAKSDFSTGKRPLPMASVALSQATTVRDISPTYWFSALQPTQVIAPPGYKPRQWAYTPGANLIWQPKGDSSITFATLRALADSWDLLRLMIEQRKDEICSLPWEIRAKQLAGETSTDQKQRNLADPNVRQLNNFFNKPDGIHPFSQWMRLWLEDMLVIDAVALWFSRDGDGKISTVHPLAGDTINRIITDQGLTPPSPQKAYQQVVYGTPVFDFTVDDMLYFMSNERTDKRYGYSKVEQLIVTINIGLRRQMFQLNYYTDGNMPEAMVFLPADLPIDRVKEVQDWFDTSLAGDLAKRRRITFLPGYGSGDEAKPNVIFPKEVLLKDAMDEWLVQTAAFCIGVSAQPFLKMVNRASAAEANDAAVEGGLGPDKQRVSTVIQECLERLGFGEEYEFVFQQHREPDVLKQAQSDNLIVGKITTINELREVRGLDARDEPEADMLGTFTQTGFMPLGQQADPASVHDDGPTTETDEQKNQPDKNKKMLKSTTAVMIDASRVTKTRRTAEKKLTKVLARGLIKAKGQVIKNLRAGYPKSLSKAADKTLNIKAIIDIDWSFLPEDVQDELIDVAMEGSTFGLGQLSLTSSGPLANKANQVAANWATDRSAEMVGMKYVDGDLEVNPNPRFAISDTTRTRLREIIRAAFNQDTPIEDLIDELNEADIFSMARAEMIARSEVSMAQNQGNLLAWRNSGLVEKVAWVVSSEHDAAAECSCQDNEDEGPYDIDDVPEFPDHPNCMCSLQAAQIVEVVQ